MNDCLFCKILKGEIPNHTIYEDDNVLAFLDIHPHAKGHTLVILKDHSETFFDLDEDSITKLFNGVQKAMNRIEEVIKPDGYNVGWNQKEVAGQVIPHLHVHIMPRWDGDGGGSQHSVITNPGDVDVEELAKLFV